MKDARKVKQLQTQLDTIKADVSVLKTEISNKRRELELKQKIESSLRTEINKLDIDQVPRVSEHALLRYLERVKGIDIAAAEKEILSDGVLKLVDQLGGNGQYPADGFSVVMKNYTVTTILK